MSEKTTLKWYERPRTLIWLLVIAAVTTVILFLTLLSQSQTISNFTLGLLCISLLAVLVIFFVGEQVKKPKDIRKLTEELIRILYEQHGTRVTLDPYYIRSEMLADNHTRFHVRGFGACDYVNGVWRTLGTPGDLKDTRWRRQKDDVIKSYGKRNITQRVVPEINLIEEDEE